MATLFRPWVYSLVEASYCQLCIFAGGQSPTGATLEQSKLEREAQYSLKIVDVLILDCFLPAMFHKTYRFVWFCCFAGPCCETVVARLELVYY